MAATTRKNLTGEKLVALGKEKGESLTSAKFHGLKDFTPKHIQSFLEYAGQNLRTLHLNSSDHPYQQDERLYQLEWLELAPSLQRFHAKNILLPAELLAHPKLKECILQGCRLDGSDVQATPTLRTLSTNDCIMYLDSLTFDQSSQIESLSFTLDEDCAEDFIRTLILDRTAKLIDLYLCVEFPVRVVFKGNLPLLNHATCQLSEPSHSSYRFDLSQFGGKPSFLSKLRA